MQVHNIILVLISDDIIANDIYNTFKVAQVSTLFYQIFKPILDNKDSLLSKKKDIIAHLHNDNHIIEIYKLIRFGYLDIIIPFYEKCQSRCEPNTEMLFATACHNRVNDDIKNNFMKIIEYFIEKGACHWNGGMVQAVENNDDELIDFFIKKGTHWRIGEPGSEYESRESLVESFKELNERNKKRHTFIGF